MPEISPFIMLLVLLGFGGLVWLALIPLWMYNRVKGIERAMWAVVSQLKHLRQEEFNDLDPEATRRARKASEPTGMISTSIFGR